MLTVKTLYLLNLYPVKSKVSFNSTGHWEKSDSNKALFCERFSTQQNKMGNKYIITLPAYN